jgi:hypothetical protein
MSEVKGGNRGRKSGRERERKRCSMISHISDTNDQTQDSLHVLSLVGHTTT